MMGKFKSIEIMFEDLSQRIGWATNRVHVLHTADVDINRRINDTNRAIAAVNRRLDEEMAMRFDAANGHTANHEVRLSALEGNPLTEYTFENGTKPNSSKKRPIYEDWDFDDNGMIRDIPPQDRGC